MCVSVCCVHASVCLFVRVSVWVCERARETWCVCLCVRECVIVCLCECALVSNCACLYVSVCLDVCV